ncbi:MAG: alkaline phosphatase family protein [Vicinamibacterales bacterium]
MHTPLDLSTRLRWLSRAALSPPFLDAQSPPPRRHLIIVVDGLRPDYVTGGVMPNLTALGKRGVVFTHHHSVYPTVTRVNASSISTGAYPETHGLMGNSVFFPKVDPSIFFDTANRDHLMKISAVEGRLLTAPTLGESLQATGRRMLVVSSGSAGSALLNNHTVAGGAILHAEFVLPERLRDEMSAAGSPPASDAPPGSRDRYAVDLRSRAMRPRSRSRAAVLMSTAKARPVGPTARAIRMV